MGCYTLFARENNDANRGSQHFHNQMGSRAVTVVMNVVQSVKERNIIAERGRADTAERSET